MIDAETVGEREHGIVRVFQMDNLDGAERTTSDLQVALGVSELGDKDTQLVDAATRDELDLTQLLEDGYGVDRAELAPSAGVLNALDGTVWLVRTAAFRDRPVTLKTDAEATLIGTFREAEQGVTFEPLPSDGADGPISSPPPKKKPTDAAMGGRVAMIALIVMAVLVIGMIIIAG